jgi:hypothetical protein
VLGSGDKGEIMRTIVLVAALAGAASVLAPAAPGKAQPSIQTVPPKVEDQLPEKAREDLAVPPPPRGRFSFAPVDEGFLRLDHKTGDVALCRAQAGNWSCASVPDSSTPRRSEIDAVRGELGALKDELRGELAATGDGLGGRIAAVEREIDAIKGEIERIKKDVAGLRPPPAPPAATAPKAERDGGVRIELPSKQDLARARVFIEDTWRRLVEMIENLQKDMMRRKADDGVSRT